MREERIAIVADVHDNIYALKCFLDFLSAEFPVTRIFNLGDFVQIGPHPKEVTDIIFSDKRFVNILGNNELSLLRRDFAAFGQGELAHQDWTINKLGSETLKKIYGLPTSIIADIGPKKALLVHSRLSSCVDQPLLYEGRSLADFFADYGSDPDYILFGHTHFQALIAYRLLPSTKAIQQGRPPSNRQVAINPGSLGCSKENLASFCLAEVGSRDVKFTFQRIHYDTAKLAADFRELEVPERENIIRAFFGMESQEDTLG